MARNMPNTHGGGAETNVTGLTYERQVDLAIYLQRHGFSVTGNDVCLNGITIANLFTKNELYSVFLAQRYPQIDKRTIWSKGLFPDKALVVGNNLYIIEIKNQNREGSVDEKLQTCDFKKKQYQRLFHGTAIIVHYFYILNEWFRRAKYRDVLSYIEEVGCRYFFDEIPLDEFGLQSGVAIH
jgi:hypothetical protein